LANILVKDAIQAWLESLTNSLTKKNYRSGVQQLQQHNIIDQTMTLQMFGLVDFNGVLDAIKGVYGWSAATKQARSALFIAFTRYLSRKTRGIIQKAEACREGTDRTFFRVRDKVASEALNYTEWQALLTEMRKVNMRDATIAAVCIQGARRIGEVLDAKIADVDPIEKSLKIMSSKGKGLEKIIFVALPDILFCDILALIGDRTTGYLFATKTGRKLDYKQFEYSLKQGAKRAKIEKRVHPHCLRASAITHYRSLGFQDFQLQRLTGHASTAMLNAYDKTDQKENISKMAALV